MGKIKVATLGGENEEALREKRRVKLEEKKKRESAGHRSDKIHLSGLKGGEKMKVVGPSSEEEIEKMAKLGHEADDSSAGKEKKEKKKAKKARVQTRGKKYQQAVTKIDPTKKYVTEEAVSLLRKVSLGKFNGTVELHLNTQEKGLRGTMQLPHGTGKEVRVKIVDGANAEKLVEELEKGKIDFDILVAHPQAMPRLAKIAKILGPRGLMPNPKSGTISTEPEKVAKKLQQGEINWKTEANFPIVHLVVGKLNFKDEQLSENIAAALKAVGKIKNATLKSTMSPGIKLKIG